MASVMLELLLIVVLLVFNGLFAMAEIALVSAKPARLQQRAEQGDSGAKLALVLTKDPEKFLSTVQVGITLVGVLAGAFGGASLAGYLTPLVERLPLLQRHAQSVSFALVVAFITYLSLIIGELVPKNLALRNPEAIAATMAKPMHWLSMAAYPIVSVLGLSTRLLMRLFGKAPPLHGPSVEEVQVLIREGLVTGGVRREESQLVEGVFDLRDVRAEEVMQPKPNVLFLEVSEKPQQYWSRVAASRQTVFPVYENSRDEILGLVSLRDLYVSAAGGHLQSLRALLSPPLFVPDNQPALSLLATLRKSVLGAALVVDEFGTTRGLISIEDLVEEVVGDLRVSPVSADTPTIREAGPQTWIVDAAIEIDRVVEQLPGLQAAVNAEEEPFQTLAGFLVHALDRLPIEGERFSAGGYEFEIIDMDRQRIDKVVIRQLEGPPPAAR